MSPQAIRITLGCRDIERFEPFINWRHSSCSAGHLVAVINILAACVAEVSTPSVTAAKSVEASHAGIPISKARDDATRKIIRR